MDDPIPEQEDSKLLQKVYCQFGKLHLVQGSSEVFQPWPCTKPEEHGKE